MTSKADPPSPSAADSEVALGAFIDRYNPEIANLARRSIATLRRRVPGAHLLVYDNYNALAVGFSAGEKKSGIVFSVTLYPRWVSLFFSRGVELEDPLGLLKGSGSMIRHIVLADHAMLEGEEVSALLDNAMAIAEPPLPETGAGQVIIKSVSAKQRPRRPA